MNSPLIPETRSRPLGASTSRARAALLSLLLLNLPALAPAQRAPNVGPAAKPAETAVEIVQLSPFEVTTEKDTGYIPQRDISGTRLNTPLRDVAAPMTIFTKEFLDDIGALTAEDVLPFLPNVTLEAQNNDASDSSYIPMRIRGQNASANSNAALTDSFTEYSDMDRYKLERIGIAPGANAILQGVGNPAGTLTSSTKSARLLRNAFEFETTFTNWGGARGVFDANYVLAKDRLALRAAVLQQYMPTHTEPAYKKDKRLYLTGTAVVVNRPQYMASVRAKYEWILTANNNGNNNLALENISPWLLAGKPLRTVPNTSTAPTVTGATSRIAADTLVDIPGLPLMNWATALTTSATSRPAFDEQITPHDISIKGKSGVQRNRANQGALTLDQRIGKDLFVQAAVFHAREENIWPIKITGATVRADPNSFLPNGQPNPNVGRFYMEHDGRSDTRLGTRDAFKLQGVYTLDLKRFSPSWGRWLGRHSLYALYQREENWAALERLQTVNTTPLPGVSRNLANRANMINHRSYFDYSKGIYWFEAYEYRQTVEKDGMRIQAMPVLQQTTSIVINNSRTLAFNSYWLDDRVVTMFGFRNDSGATYTAKPVADPVTGLTPLARSAPVGYDLSGKFKPTSKGVVVHALRWLSLTYNESENFADGADQRLDHFGRNLPTRGGATKDYGLRLNLLRDRLSLSLTKYESGSVNGVYSSGVGNIAEINRIWTALGETAKRIPDFPTTRATFDNLARGYELSLTFNPTRNWRFYLAGAKNSTTLTNVAPAFRAYVEQNAPVWLQRPTVVTSDVRTVAEENDLIQDAVARAVSQNGVQEFNMREYTGSFVGAYSFTEGRLKGVKVTANFKYFGDAFVGVPVISGVAHPERSFIEKGYSQVGLGASYTRRLTSKVEWFTSLQVRNAFDYDGRVIVVSRTADAVGAPLKAMWIPGINANMTTGLKF